MVIFTFFQYSKYRRTYTRQSCKRFAQLLSTYEIFTVLKETKAL